MFRHVALGLTLAASVALSAPALAEETFKIDSEGMHAQIGFRTLHLGYSWLSGRFDKFDGSFTFNEKSPAESAIVVNIDATSLNSNHAKRDEHLRSADFFDVANHPTAKFESTKIEVTGDKTGVITGDLTLRGVTKPLSIDVEYIGGGDDPWGGFRRGFTGTAEIVPADFGMPHMIAKQTVYLTLDVEGIRQ
ncbi:MAG: YceI family protein [Kiloniellales bacterium]|nr:YceI family protein [Kiloniellales bacterium]